MNTVNTVTPFPGFSLYTRAYGGILLWGSQCAQVFTLSGYGLPLRVGAALVCCLRLTAFSRCPESPARQVKLLKSLILQYPDKIGHSLWSLRCYLSRRRDIVRTIPEIV